MYKDRKKTLTIQKLPKLFLIIFSFFFNEDFRTFFFCVTHSRSYFYLQHRERVLFTTLNYFESLWFNFTKQQNDVMDWMHEIIRTCWKQITQEYFWWELFWLRERTKKCIFLKDKELFLPDFLLMLKCFFYSFNEIAMAKNSCFGWTQSKQQAKLYTQYKSLAIMMK